MPEREGHSKFIVPATIQEAQQRSYDLLTKILMIENQLSDPDRKDASGQRLDPAEYRKWRHAAIMAMTHYKSERTQLLNWIRDYNNRFLLDQAPFLSEPVQSKITKA